MYGRYVFTAAATILNIIDDIAAIIAGQTNAASLIAAVSPDTELDGTIATTWSVYDNATGSDNPRVILRSQISDAASKYKYIGLGDAGSGNMAVYTYESWNSTTHTGTNAVSISLAITPGTSKQITISANSKGVYVSRPAVDATTVCAGMVITEFDRWDVWRTTAATYPDAVLCSAVPGWGTSPTNGAPVGYNTPFADATRCQAPRIKSGNANGDLTARSVNWAPIHMALWIGSASSGNFTKTAVRSADETVYYPMAPMAVGRYNDGFMGGMMSNYADLYWTSLDVGGNFTEMTVSGATYVVNKIDANNALLIRKN